MHVEKLGASDWTWNMKADGMENMGTRKRATRRERVRESTRNFPTVTSSLAFLFPR